MSCASRFQRTEGVRSQGRAPFFTCVAHEAARSRYWSPSRRRTTDMSAKRAQYRKKASQYVVAVRLDLETDGLVYRKWGGTQRAKAGDWLVDNDGDIYTVDAEVFARTYERVLAGVYI